jgi:hypothetical protein
MRELVELIQECVPEARERNREIAFALVYPDKNGINVLRPVVKVASHMEGPDDRKTVEAIRLQPGDYLAVNISTSHK